MKYFTKKEAVSLLGETVICKKAVVQQCPGTDLLLTLFDVGEKANVVLVESQPDIEGVFISLLIDGDYLPFRKDMFDCHCSLLSQSKGDLHASAG